MAELDNPSLACHVSPMREKELRLALICYGGISLAVYMHGITKEVWRLARASRAFHSGEEAEPGSETVAGGEFVGLHRPRDGQPDNGERDAPLGAAATQTRYIHNP